MVVPLKKHSCITTERLNRRIVSKIVHFSNNFFLKYIPDKDR